MAALAERRKDLLDAMMREAIYEGAVAVLSSHGLGGTTMDRVAAAAGVAKGTLYNHFRSKRDLLEFVHAKTIEPVDEAMEEILRSELPAADKLWMINRMWRDNVTRRRAAFEFLISDQSARSILANNAKTGRRRAIEQIASVIEEGIAAGEFRPVHAIRVAEMLVGANIGMIEEEFALGEERSDKETSDVLLDVFLNGLVAGKTKEANCGD